MLSHKCAEDCLDAVERFDMICGSLETSAHRVYAEVSQPEVAQRASVGPALQPMVEQVKGLESLPLYRNLAHDMDRKLQAPSGALLSLGTCNTRARCPHRRASHAGRTCVGWH